MTKYTNLDILTVPDSTKKNQNSPPEIYKKDQPNICVMNFNGVYRHQKKIEYAVLTVIFCKYPLIHLIPFLTIIPRGLENN